MPPFIVPVTENFFVTREFFSHFSEEGHCGFLEDIKVIIIDRLTGSDRMRESFWQYKLDSFTPIGPNIRLVDSQ